MEDKNRNTKETSENIKAELTALLKLNKKRKAALEKMSKSILNEEDESFNNEQKSPQNK